MDSYVVRKETFPPNLLKELRRHQNIKGFVVFLVEFYTRQFNSYDCRKSCFWSSAFPHISLHHREQDADCLVVV